MKRLFELFSVFFKIGLFTFGGGLAMIPFIQSEIVNKKKWITDDEMIDIIAIAESTPGVIAVNAATFVGYKIARFWGGLWATIGVVLPSLVIIIIISFFFQDFLNIPVVYAIFKGIRVGVAVLIFNAGLKLFKKLPKIAINFMLIALAIGLSIFVHLNSFFIILIGGCVGIIFQLISSQRRRDQHD